MFDFRIAATCGAARTGTLTLPHGRVETPVFMPVGTQGSVRALSPADLKGVGAAMILANTYHLHVRPGEDIVAQLGGLHRFMAWDRPLLTDSGGFQVFSLAGFRRVDEDGVEFQSHVDGARRVLTPERATEIQWTLGADVAMAFDHVAPGAADGPTARDALERTLRWLERCAARHRQLADGRQTLWPILQGGVHPTLRREALRRILEMGGGAGHGNRADGRQTLWPILQGGVHPTLRREALRRILEMGEWTGLAVGGLSVGEPKAKMYEVLELLEPRLPGP